VVVKGVTIILFTQINCDWRNELHTSFAAAPGSCQSAVIIQNGDKSGRGKVVLLFLIWVQERAPAWMNVEAEAYVVCRHLERTKVRRDGSIKNL